MRARAVGSGVDPGDPAELHLLADLVGVPHDHRLEELAPGALGLATLARRLSFTEVRGPGAAAIRLEGADGGSATGEARASENEDPVAIAEKCSGDGLRGVRIHIDLTTTPSISG